MDTVLAVEHLNKIYAGFSLQDVSFSIEPGSVMGFIGRNGAGKSTTIKAILNLIHRNSGKISILGMDNLQEEKYIKQQIGVVLSDNMFPSYLCAGEIDKLMKLTYKNWDSSVFLGLTPTFHFDLTKSLSKYSSGMRMKLNIATALSHHPHLLILDEPTSGLDPIGREEILDLFWDYLQDETHSILFSTHITSDLDKIADSITLIDRGQILLSASHEQILEQYGILKCSIEQLHSLEKNKIQAVRQNPYGAEVLVYKQSFKNIPLESVNIEQLMLFLTNESA